MGLSTTMLKVTLPSGAAAVYEVSPQHLNEVEGTTLSERARFFGVQVAVRFADGHWYRNRGNERIDDPRTIALLEGTTEA